MKRWAWNIFCMLSLLVFVSSVTLWVRSYVVGDNISWRKVQTSAPPLPVWTQGWYYEIEVGEGNFRICRFRSLSPGPSSRSTGWTYEGRKPSKCEIPAGPLPGDVILQLGGHGVLHNVSLRGNGWISQQWLALPLWLFLPAAIPPLLWWRKRRKKGGRGFAVEVTSGADNVNQAKESNDAQRAQRHKDHREKSI